MFLRFLNSSAFEPVHAVSIRNLTITLLVSLTSARRVSELQALSRHVFHQTFNFHVFFLPEFRTKTESETKPIPRSFVIRRLNDFVGDAPQEMLLCPSRALKTYIQALVEFSLDSELFSALPVSLPELYLRMP